MKVRERLGKRTMQGLAAAAILGCVWPFPVDRAAAQAADTPALVGFKTPTSNIHCMLDEFGPPGNNPVGVRCDIREIQNAHPPRPRSCDLDWGQTFGISFDGTMGQRLCASDTVADDKWPVLAYGGIWQMKGFTCHSEQSGLTCFNVRRHGFTLSRSSQKLF